MTTPAFPDLAEPVRRRPRRTCVTSAPNGLVQADAFLSQRVPKITAALACQDRGLIAITFDEGSDSAPAAARHSVSALTTRTCRCPAGTGRRPHRRGPAVPLIRPGTVGTAMSLGSTR
jgi:hypothetical protein